MCYVSVSCKHQHPLATPPPPLLGKPPGNILEEVKIPAQGQKHGPQGKIVPTPQGNISEDLVSIAY